MKHRIFIIFLMTGVLFSSPVLSSGQDETLRIAPAETRTNISLVKETKHSLETAFKYLLSSQLPNGSWKNDPAITSLVLYSFVLHPSYNPDEETEKAVSKGYEFVKSFVKPDGGIYRNEYKNYVTAVCLMAFTENSHKKYKEIITNAKNFLIKFQADEDEGYTKDHPYYGGIGYGGDQRPDMSNTQLALEAIKAAEDYESRYDKIVPDTANAIEKEEKELGMHWQKALVFLARCQNVKAVNNMPYAADDGGFIYETGTYKEERSHSYGSMTYAGVKSLLYAQVDKEDIRLQKAVSWIKSHYTLEENPGFENGSLYYYYMTFAKCLDALGGEIIEDSQGKKHNWPEEFLGKLISLQKEDGYWVNENGRFWENIKDLATAYSVIGVKFALKGMIDR